MAELGKAGLVLPAVPERIALTGIPLLATHLRPGALLADVAEEEGETDDDAHDHGDGLNHSIPVRTIGSTELHAWSTTSFDTRVASQRRTTPAALGCWRAVKRPGVKVRR
jgi:hypothetical protein